MSSTPSAPRGWYPDPQTPGRDRWWDGSNWTEFTHRAASSLSAGPRYTRSYWVGPNLNAGRSRLFAYIGTLLMLAVIIFIPFAASPYNRFAGATWLVLAGFALAGISEGLAIVFASLALRRSTELGARGLALSNLIIGAVESGICLIGVLVTALMLAFPGSTS